MFNLSGKKALVTGATGGIGLAIVESFVAQGAQVVVTGTRQAVLDEIATRFPSQVIPIAANLSTVSEAKRLASESVAALEGLDILVNNAGITKDGLMMRMSQEQWDSVIEMNLTSVFSLTQALLRVLMKSSSGRIINISSVVGASGNAGQVNYSAAKAGLIGFTKSLAYELSSRRVTVNAIAPGYIETPMTEAIPEKQKELLLSKIPLSSMGKPEDIAAASVFLSSDEARYITGTTLHVNGGLYMA